MSDKTQHHELPQAFADLGVRPSILKGLAEMNFVEPSEIQKLVIPRALDGADILGQARTGTGKTAAFGIPLLQKVARGVGTQAIILAPTRELAMQIEEEITEIGKHTSIRTVCVYGGQRITAQQKRLKHLPELVVGTPGRVMDLLDRGIISFENVRFVVLDEVDRMLDIGFRDDIRTILGKVREHHKRGGTKGRRRAAEDSDEAPDRRSDDPADGENEPLPDPTETQTIFVSATIAGEIEKLARTYMRQGKIEKLIAPGADESPTVEKVKQFVVPVEPWDKYRCLRQLMKTEMPELAIIFTRTKHGADKIAIRLNEDGINCTEIHGNLRQSKRDSVMKKFKDGHLTALIATDLASRGIDVEGITHIINYDVPEDPEVYVHRIGRTARMGAEGKSYTFVAKDQGEQLTKVESLINMLIPTMLPEGFEPNPQPADWTEGKPMGRRNPRDDVNSIMSRVLGAPAEPVVSESGEPAKPATRRRGLGGKLRRGRR